MARTLCIDVETSAIPIFKPWQAGSFLVAVGLADEYGFRQNWVFNHQELKGGVIQRPMIDQIQKEIDTSIRIVGHNLKFDLAWLRSIGLNFDKQRLYCTQLAEYLIRGQGPLSYSLDDCCKRHNIPTKIDKVKMYWESGYNTDEIPLHILLPYLTQDCISTLSLYQRQVPLLKRQAMERLFAVQSEALRVLADIEWNGMYADKAAAEGLIEEFKAKSAYIDRELTEMFGWDVNLNSGDELSAALFGGTIKRDGVEQYTQTLKNGTVKKKTRKCVVETKVEGVGFTPPNGSAIKKEGFYSTSKDVITQLGGRKKVHKEIKELLMERSVTKKILETFQNEDGVKGLVNKIEADKCIHPQYNQSVTRTGRLSSSSPNGQNLPRKGTSPIKQIFVSRYDKIVVPDLSQLEWRVVGHLSQDREIIKEVTEGIDAHLDNAVNFFGDAKFRHDAKIFTFRMIYGGSAYSFYMDQAMPNFGLKKWKEIVEQFYEKYHGLKEWQNKNIALVNKKGYLTSATGRRLAFEKHPVKGYNVKQIKNYPVQSLATADIMPLAMVVIARKLKDFKTLLIGQVHDSLVMDVPEEEVNAVARISIETFEDLPRLIEQTWGFKFTVPLTGEVEVGTNYGQLSKYEIAV